MSKSLIRKQAYTGRPTDAALHQELVRLSKAHPGRAVLAGGAFGRVTIYVYRSLASIPVDSPESRAMLADCGKLAYVNGRLSAPTPGWQRQQTRVDKANTDH